MNFFVRLALIVLTSFFVYVPSAGTLHALMLSTTVQDTNPPEAMFTSIYDNDYITAMPLLRGYIKDDVAVSVSSITFKIDDVLTPGVIYDTTTYIFTYQVNIALTEGEHYFSIEASDLAGNISSNEVYCKVSGTDLVVENVSNFPNPFNTTTKFAVMISKQTTEVKVEIYTFTGEPVRSLTLSSPGIGYNELEWDGKNEAGNAVARGVYFYNLTVKPSSGNPVNYLKKMVKK